MKAPLKVLIVEDDYEFSKLLGVYLKKMTLWNVEHFICNSANDALAKSSEFKPDVSIVDYMLGDKTGIELILNLRKAGCRSAFIMLTGVEREQVAIKALRANANDFLLKGELTPETLEDSLRHVIERKKADEAIKLERDWLINILDSMVDGVYIVNQQYDIEYVNPVIRKEFGPDISHKCYEYFHDRKEICPWCKNQDVFKGKTVRWEWYSPKNQKTYDLIDTPLKNPDGTISKLEIFRDITDQKQLEKKLKTLATTDTLTEAYSRSKFGEIITKEMERAKRYNHLLCIIMFDIDHFKEINDTYGHLAGDNVLKIIADIVREHIRKIDYFIRWGGEEFIIIVPETDLKNAEALSERIRKVVEVHKFDNAGKTTVSFGVTESKKEDTVDSFIKRADDAMYLAKRNGRNRVETS